MDTTHHIPAELMAAYAAGSLPEAYSLVVACHVSLCDACRADLAAFEAVGGAVLDALPGFTPDAGSFEATLALIDALPAEAPAQTRIAQPSVFPAPLQEYAGPDASAVRWRAVGGGVRQAVLDCAGPATARLLYIPAGKAVPEHGHNGLELTLVLQGAFADAGGRFGRGDVEVGDGTLQHQPVAEPGEACICLAATDAPLKFKGIFPRLFQPFIGI